MKQEELKLLAEWGGEKFIILLENNWFNPLLDSNQLDMLEDKMIEELKEKWGLKQVKMEIAFYEDEVNVFTRDIYDKQNFVLVGGKTKNEARLNAILNYVKELSK